MTSDTQSITAQAPARPITRARPWARARGWRAAAGLTCVAAGAAVIAGAFLPWVEAFAGLIQVPGVSGANGKVLAAIGAVIAGAGLLHLTRHDERGRWLGGVAGFAAAGFAGYLLIQLARSLRVLGGDSMVIARGGPGLWVVAAGSLAAFATLLFPPSSQATILRDARRPALAAMADRESAGLRRGLQISLGGIWLLDAALQYQPSMFGRTFPGMVLMSGMGQPAFVSGPVLTTARLISDAIVPANALFATIQLSLAAGLLFRATAKAALAGTVAWSLAVWWLGEGLGGIFTGSASPLTGAPGAAVLYALLAVLLWPRASRWGRLSWFILWAGMAALLLLAPSGSAGLTAAGGTRAAIMTAAFAAAFAFAAAGMLVPATVRPAVVVAVLAALVIWVAGEHFGQLFSGSATDPNSGPLLVLIAVAFWPVSGRARGGDGGGESDGACVTEGQGEGHCGSGLERGRMLE